MSERRRADPIPLGGGDEPYSKGLMARALMRVGVSAVRAYEVARRIEQELLSRKQDSIELDRVEELAEDVLGENEGEKAVRRLRRFSDLAEIDLPLIVLIGGATGTGKSTVATEVAYRLGVTRVTSTDFVRQTLRAFFSPEFMPSIHYSIFEAGRALRRGGRGRPAPARVPRPDAERARGRECGHRALARRGLVDRARGRAPRPGHDGADLGRARRAMRARDPERGRAREPLLDPRRRLGRSAVARQVPRPPLGHPLSPGLHCGTGGKGRGSRALET